MNMNNSAKKFVLIPDSFKGTLSSSQVCEVMSRKIRQFYPESEILSIPVADGGEGSVECFISASGGEIIKAKCADSFFEESEAFYGVLNDGKTAVIELAACCGLPQVKGRENPSLTTTYGVGQLILSAAERGCKKIIVCLGGSSTNDGGCGAAAAVGIRFLKDDGSDFIPVGGTLKDIAKIDISGRNSKLDGVEMITMCDIDNPMYGKEGAACVFAKQKGADSEMIKQLDAGLVHLSEIIKRDINTDVSAIPGAGAAGAMGAGTVAFFGSRLESGIDTVLKTVNFGEVIKDADVIFTGEGRIDSQSIRGKVISGIAKAAKAAEKPVIAVVGSDESVDEVYKMGVTAVFSINRKAEDFSLSRYKSEANLEKTVENIVRLIKCFDGTMF